ncbi:MAG: DUF5667 domain-containing protein [Nocardioides sp.]|nr:DUF5667 domain-containing protein [Nocardioides sp.]
MISRIPARRRAEDFAARVDARSADSRASHEVSEESDAALFALVGALRSTEAPAPRPEFVGDLRERLMTEAAEVLSPAAAHLTLPPRTRGARERRFVAAASVAVLLGGSASMAAAAQNALPGEALYPIKRGLEQAGTSLSLSEDGKGSRILGQAAGRLDEIARLAATGGPALEDQVAATLEDFTSQAREGAALLFASYEQSGDADDVTEVRDFNAESLGVLAVLAQQLPPSLGSHLSTAAVALQDLDVTAAELCAECGPASIVDLPTVLLAHAEAGRALDASRAADSLVNDHPVALDKGLGLPVLPGSVPAPSAAPAPEQPAPSVGPGTPSPSQLATNNDLARLIPSLVTILRGGAVSQDSTSGPDQPGSTATPKETESPGLLEDLVGTLLPDPDEDLLP